MLNDHTKAGAYEGEKGPQLKPLWPTKAKGPTEVKFKLKFSTTPEWLLTLSNYYLFKSIFVNLY